MIQKKFILNVRITLSNMRWIVTTSGNRQEREGKVRRIMMTSCGNALGLFYEDRIAWLSLRLKRCIKDLDCQFQSYVTIDRSWE